MPQIGKGRVIAACAAIPAGALLLSLIATGPAGAASVSTWEKVAECESGGNWSINTGNGYYGGLQFSLSTWRAYGGTQYADYPHQATKQEQILIGEKVLAAQGEGAWPVCGPRAGLGSDTAEPYPSSPPPPSVPSGTVWDRSRSASGTWQSHAVQIDDNGDI
ncbi:transglycosylase family protein, partial [Streptomyces macrosporus]